MSRSDKISGDTSLLGRSHNRRRGLSVAASSTRHGIAGARRAPAPATISAQLASLVERPPLGDQWLHEIKFDGYRMLAHLRYGKALLMSRNGLDWSGRSPELAEVLGHLPATEAWLDGEVVHMGAKGITSFSALQKDISDGATARLIYMVFDLLYLDGDDLTAARLEDRKTLLAATLAKARRGIAPTIRYSDHQVGKGPNFFARACKQGFEGVVSKDRDARRRATAWLVLAVPVAPPDTLAELRNEADEAVCIETPPMLGAIGSYYGDFHQMTDAEVIDLMTRAPRPSERPSEHGVAPRTS